MVGFLFTSEYQKQKLVESAPALNRTTRLEQHRQGGYESPQFKLKMSKSKSTRSRIPAACRDGKKRTLETLRVSTPIGCMLLHICCQGLHMICQEDEITDENFVPNPSEPVLLLSKPPQDLKVNGCLKNCLDWLQTYFHNVHSLSELCIPPLCAITEDRPRFRDRVLVSLAKNVPFGKTVTYGELASLAGSPGAQQAVGTAMSTNPFQLIVPCHRVVKSGNKVGKYSGGCRNSVKVWLLQHEGLSVDETGSVLAS